MASNFRNPYSWTALRLYNVGADILGFRPQPMQEVIEINADIQSAHKKNHTYLKFYLSEVDY